MNHLGYYHNTFQATVETIYATTEERFLGDFLAQNWTWHSHEILLTMCIDMMLYQACNVVIGPIFEISELVVAELD